MKILITGGTGYLGSVLTRQLLAAGHTVRTVSRTAAAAPPADILPARLEHLEYIAGDIREPHAAWFTGIDAFVHLAGIGSAPLAEQHPALAEALGITATEKLLALLARSRAGSAVVASSTSLYEQDSQSVYARTKRAAEHLWRDAAPDFCNVQIARIGSMYGPSPAMRYDVLVNTMTQAAALERRILVHNGGEIQRPLIAVSDAADAIRRLLEPAPRHAPQTLDLVTANMRVRDVAAAICEEAAKLGSSIELVDEPSERVAAGYQGSTRDMVERYGWQPRTDVRREITTMLRQSSLLSHT